MIMQGLDGQLGQGSHQDLIYATELHFSTILMSCCYGFVRSTLVEVEFTGPLSLRTAMLILVSMAVCRHKRSVNSTSINVNFLRFNEGLLHCLSCSSLSPSSVFPFPLPNVPFSCPLSFHHPLWNTPTLCLGHPTLHHSISLTSI